MFTGIVIETGMIAAITQLNGGLEFQIECSFAADTHIDESISVNGVCQTVTENSPSTFTVQAVEETLRKTNFNALSVGDPVNLERSLTLNDRIEGHLVQGHVDTTGKIIAFEKEGTNWLLTVELPAEYTNYVVGRGSIALDGISLTVARETADSFTVAIIPYTYEHTNLKNRNPGDMLNLEFDIFGKYVMKYLSNLNNEKKRDITAQKLKQMGY